LPCRHAAWRIAELSEVTWLRHCRHIVPLFIARRIAGPRSAQPSDRRATVGPRRRSRVQSVKGTRSSVIAEGPRDAPCQLKSCQLPRNSAETIHNYTTSPDQIDGMKLEV